MNVIVCVKQVLDTTDVKFDPATGRLKREGQPVTINALDEYAVEEALRLKEKHGGTVTALAMGPESAVETLRHAVAMGADEAVHVCDPALVGADTWVTAWTLSHALATMGAFDLVICGAETLDGNTAYVGPAAALALGIPYVAFVQKIEEIGGGKMTVQRMMEEGSDRIETALPALITVVKAINVPRISSLKGKMRAKKYQPKMLKAADVPGLRPEQLGTAGASTRVLRTFPPEARASGQVFTGEPDEVAEKLYQALAN